MKQTKRSANLADKQEVIKLMRHLYNNNGVKDDIGIDNTYGESGTARAREVVKLPPNCS